MLEINFGQHPFYRQKTLPQRSEPNKTVSEFHLSAVKGIVWGMKCFLTVHFNTL